MKILIFNWRDIRNPRSGGAEVLTHQVAKGWAEKGHKVVLFSSFFKGAEKKEVLDNIEIIRAGNSLTVYWQAYSYYRKFFKGHFDIIIDEINTAPFFTNFYVKEKVVCHINQLAREVWFYESFFPLSVIGYLTEPFILKTYRNKPVITISESTREDLLKLGFKKDKISIIPMGIDFKPLQEVATKENIPTLIYVGRLKKSKRVHDIIEAFKLIKKKITNCKLQIVGNGDILYKKKLYEMAKDLDDIEFFHDVDDKEKLSLMKRAHLIIVTSIREGWGLIVTEANAMGTPAVGYKVAGLKDSIKEGINGIFTKENKPSELSKSILTLLENKELMENLSKTSLEDSRKYNWDSTSEESLKIIEDVLKKNI